MSGIGQGGTGVLKVDGTAVATQKMEHTVPLILQWDETFDIGSDTGTPVDDQDYQVPFEFTGKLAKLTIKVDRPKLTPEDEKLLLGGRVTVAGGGRRLGDRARATQRWSHRDRVGESAFGASPLPVSSAPLFPSGVAPRRTCDVTAGPVGTCGCSGRRELDRCDRVASARLVGSLGDVGRANATGRAHDSPGVSYTSPIWYWLGACLVLARRVTQPITQIPPLASSR